MKSPHHEPLWLTCQKSTKTVYLSPEITNKLKKHQIDGVRFLYRQYEKNAGAVLNDDFSLGKCVQICSFIKAVLNSGISSPILLLCKTDESKLKYQYHLEEFVNVKFGNFQNLSQNLILVESLSHFISPAVINSKEYDVVILEWTPEYLNKSTNFLNYIKTNRRIAIFDEDLLCNLEYAWEVFNWINPGRFIEKNNFISKYSSNDWKTKSLLQNTTTDFYLRRDSINVDVSLPLIDPEEYQSLFKDWIEFKNLKLYLSDSQSQIYSSAECLSSTDSNRDVVFIQESIPMIDLCSDSDIVTITRDIPNNNTIIRSICNSPDLFASSLESTTDIARRTDAANDVASNNINLNQSLECNDINDVYNGMSHGLIDFNQNTTGCKRKNSEIAKTPVREFTVCAISPSNYTSDETFNKSDLLFFKDLPKTPRKKRRVTPNKSQSNTWLTKQKQMEMITTRGFHTDSSDESLNVDKPISRTVINNARTAKYTESFLDMILFSDSNIRRNSNVAIDKSRLNSNEAKAKLHDYSKAKKSICFNDKSQLLRTNSKVCETESLLENIFFT